MLFKAIFLIIFFSLFFLVLNIKNSKNFHKYYGLNSIGFILILSCLILNFFNSNTYYFQYVISLNLINLNFLNINYILALDGFSILFFGLTTFLVFLCVLFLKDEYYFKIYLINLLILEFILLIIFSILDIFIFYIFFEAILIPMFFQIGVFGSRERKIRAAYLLSFYTILGSTLMFYTLLFIYDKIGTLSIENLLDYKFSNFEQLWIWFPFFFSFASKMPMFPFHIWLPEAHVEAPTVGSVLLAGILLKLGVYGFFRFNLSLLADASLYFLPFVYLFSILGILYASLNALRQTDLKRIIAYSSIAHMSTVSIAIFSFNINSLEGALFQSISHGFVASALFFIVGMLYNRYHSRFIFYYSGLIHIIPTFGYFFLFFTFSNIALPGTSSFIGEFLILMGLFKMNIICAFIATSSVILSGAYSLWLYNTTMFGNLKNLTLLNYSDLTVNEMIILSYLKCMVFILGIYPSFFFKFFHIGVIDLFLKIF